MTVLKPSDLPQRPLSKYHQVEGRGGVELQHMKWQRGNTAACSVVLLGTTFFSALELVHSYSFIK